MVLPRTSSLLLAAAIVTAPVEARSLRKWDQASTVTGVAVATLALGIPLIKSDGAGAAQAALSIGTATGTAFALKSLIDERRPDGSDHHSFPSGHASFSFAAAATLEKRYGWQYGVPAFALASFVGVARVEAKRHHWYDVAAGAAIGSASSFLFTHRAENRANVSLWGGLHSGGASMRLSF